MSIIVAIVTQLTRFMRHFFHSFFFGCFNLPRTCSSNFQGIEEGDGGLTKNSFIFSKCRLCVLASCVLAWHGYYFAFSSNCQISARVAEKWLCALIMKWYGTRKRKTTKKGFKQLECKDRKKYKKWKGGECLIQILMLNPWYTCTRVWCRLCRADSALMGGSIFVLFCFVQDVLKKAVVLWKLIGENWKEHTGITHVENWKDCRNYILLKRVWTNSWKNIIFP